MDWLRNVRKGGDIQRYHTTPMVKTQDVAQHSFNAALMAEWLVTSIKSKLSHVDLIDIDTHKIVMHMLIHDVPEVAIGDVPGWVKANSPDIKNALDAEEVRWCHQHMPERHFNYMFNLTDEEVRVAKFIDLAECCYKLIQDVKLGNSVRKDDVIKCLNVLAGWRDEWYDEINIGHTFFTQMIDDVYQQLEECP